MCSLQSNNRPETNMRIFKIHGGIAKLDIHDKVKETIKVAQQNKSLGIHQTVLFFDEANTTTAISTIKTIMCDRYVDGEKIPTDIGLQFVAAVNPYRQHSEEMIKKLEASGLGYHIEVCLPYYKNMNL